MAKFNTLRAAAIAATAEIARLSANDDFEWGTWLLKCPAGGYSYATPFTNQKIDSVDLGTNGLPENRVGALHSHTGDSEEYRTEFFSTDDLSVAASHWVSAYMWSRPSGTLYELDIDAPLDDQVADKMPWFDSELGLSWDIKSNREIAHIGRNGEVNAHGLKSAA
jgi:hypothetical protein